MDGFVYHGFMREMFSTPTKLSDEIIHTSVEFNIITFRKILTFGQ